MEAQIKLDEKPDYGLLIIKTMFAMALFVFAGYFIFSSHIVANSVTIVCTFAVFVFLSNKHKDEMKRVGSLLFIESLKTHDNIVQSFLVGDFKHSETLFESGLICDRLIEIYPDKRFMMGILYHLKSSSIIDCLMQNPKIQNFIKKIFLDDFEKRLHYRLFLDKQTIVELVKKNVLHEILRNKVRKGL